MSPPPPTEERRSLADERADIKSYVMDDGGDMKQIVLAILNLTEEVRTWREERRREAARLEVEETLETPYLAEPPEGNKKDWREAMRKILENVRPAVEAMKAGQTTDYMLTPEGMIALFDGLEEALRATAADKDWRSLPEYSKSLPTWQMGEDGKLIGVKKWKRFWTKADGGNFWMIGEAFMFPNNKRVNILWSRPE